MPQGHAKTKIRVPERDSNEDLKEKKGLDKEKQERFPP